MCKTVIFAKGRNSVKIGKSIIFSFSFLIKIKKGFTKKINLSNCFICNDVGLRTQGKSIGDNKISSISTNSEHKDILSLKFW